MPKLLYIASRGTNDPTGASLPFHLAADGAAEAGIECAIALVGDAAVLIRDPVADQVTGVGLPALRELIAKVVARRTPIYVLGASGIARGASDADLSGKNARFISPIELAQLTADATHVLTF
jgi:predicted peroxiredoxin